MEKSTPFIFIYKNHRYFKMNSVRRKPDKPREIAVRPERLAKVRNPEKFKERKTMSEVPTFISSKKSQLEEENAAQSDVVQVLARLSAVTTATAQADVATANSAESVEERLAIMNQCVVNLVTIVANTSQSVSANALRYRFSIDLLDQMLLDSDVPDDVPDEVEDTNEDTEGSPEEDSEPPE